MLLAGMCIGAVEHNMKVPHMTNQKYHVASNRPSVYIHKVNESESYMDVYSPMSFALLLTIVNKQVFTC